MTISQLPERFPVGTHYVIEGRPGKAGRLQIVSRRIILPDGQAFDLKDGTATHRRARRASPSTRRRAK